MLVYGVYEDVVPVWKVRYTRCNLAFCMYHQLFSFPLNAEHREDNYSTCALWSLYFAFDCKGFPLEPTAFAYVSGIFQELPCMFDLA